MGDRRRIRQTQRESGNMLLEPVADTGLTITIASARAAINGDGETILVWNPSSTLDAHIAFGGSDVTAADTNLCVPAREERAFTRPINADASLMEYIAGKLDAAGTVTLIVTSCNGNQ
jgi:hypothetical protein